MRSKLWVELAPASYSTGLAFLIYGQAVISKQLLEKIRRQWISDRKGDGVFSLR